MQVERAATDAFLLTERARSDEAVANRDDFLGMVAHDVRNLLNAVAPGPIWTPLIPATGWTEKQIHFGDDTPLGRPGQPAELAGAYVYLASEQASYVSGAVVPVTGGKHL